jgi:hypothetical protein
MSLCFGKLTHAIHERESLAEIRKRKCARNVVPVRHFPLRHLPLPLRIKLPFGLQQNSKEQSETRAAPLSLFLGSRARVDVFAHIGGEGLFQLLCHWPGRSSDFMAVDFAHREQAAVRRRNENFFGGV